MVTIANQVIKSINVEYLKNIGVVIGDKDFSLYSDIVIRDSVIELLDFAAIWVYSELRIENCTIHTLNIPYCWFIKGVVLKDNIIFNDINYEAGGHNKRPVIIESNRFQGFFDFFDCQFDDKLILKNNIFEKGCGLLKYINEPGDNKFKSGLTIENNIGLDDQILE